MHDARDPGKSGQIEGSARVAVLNEAGEFIQTSLPIPQEDRYGLLEVELTGICGTDLKLQGGKIPSPRPLILGHEILGRVLRLPAESGLQNVSVGSRVILNAMLPCWSCPPCWSGDWRHCSNRVIYGVTRSVHEGSGLWGGFASHVAIAPGSILHPVPDGLDPGAAVLLGVVANAFEWAVLKGGVVPGSRVVIQGPGAQGIACAIVARQAGAEEVIVTGLTRDSLRLAMAARLSGASTIRADSTNPEEAVAEITKGAMADVLIDVTGSPQAVAVAPRLVRRGGSIVLAGLAGSPSPLGIDLDDLVWREIQVQGALGKTSRAYDAATKIVSSNQAALSQIVTHRYPLDDVSQAFEDSASPDPARLPIKAVVDPVK